MAYRLTSHVNEEIARRGIPRALLDRVIAEPQQVVPVGEGRRVYQSQLDFGDGKIYLLRVVVDETTAPPSVVTAYRTSKIAKYWRPAP